MKLVAIKVHLRELNILLSALCHVVFKLENIWNETLTWFKEVELEFGFEYNI